MSVIQSGEAVAAASGESCRECMLIVGSPRVRIRVVARQGTVEPALKAFSPRKINAIARAHLIGQSHRTHIRLVDGLRYVDDGIGVVKSGHTLNGQVRLERVVGVYVFIFPRQLPARGQLPEEIDAPVLMHA